MNHSYINRGSRRVLRAGYHIVMRNCFLYVDFTAPFFGPLSQLLPHL